MVVVWLKFVVVNCRLHVACCLVFVAYYVIIEVDVKC